MVENVCVRVCHSSLSLSQLEDDIVARPNYFTTMKNFALQQPLEEWMILEFSQLGFIGESPAAPSSLDPERTVIDRWIGPRVGSIGVPVGGGVRRGRKSQSELRLTVELNAADQPKHLICFVIILSRLINGFSRPPPNLPLPSPSGFNQQTLTCGTQQ